MKALRSKKIRNILLSGFIVGSFISGSLFAYMGQPGPNPNAPQYYMNNTTKSTGQMGYGQGMGYGVTRQTQGQIGVDDIVQQQTLHYIIQLPTQTLDDQEKEKITYMREEEKLARDVYLTLYDKWRIPIFKNIARSEQNHMDAIKVLIEKYGLEDPVEQTNNEVGKFVNEKLQQLYEQLVNQGSQSLEEALKVGATIEDLDIKDLEYDVAETDNEDIKIIYNNLMKGSRNHLRAFTSQLERYGETYQCQFISQEECESIVNSEWERGISYGPNNKQIFNGTLMYSNNQRMGNNYGHNMGVRMGAGRRNIDLNMIRQNKMMMRQQIAQRMMLMRQQIQQIRARIMERIRNRGVLDPQTRQQAIITIKQTLMTKLEDLLVEIVDTPLEEKYSQQIQDLMNQLDSSFDVNSLRKIYLQYKDLKVKIKNQLNNQ